MVFDAIMEVDIYTQRHKQDVKRHPKSPYFEDFPFHGTKIVNSSKKSRNFAAYLLETLFNSIKMKKLTLILAAVVMGFVMTSCGDSTKDAIMKDVDNYFTQAEQKLAAIDNVDDFIAFAVSMNDRSEILNLLDEKYGQKEISDEDNEAIQNFIYDRATTYNQTEAQKCAEYLTPALERFEKAVDALYFCEEELDEETFFAMYGEMDDAEDEVLKFADCENIPEDLINRFSAAEDKRAEMFDNTEEEVEE